GDSPAGAVPWLRRHACAFCFCHCRTLEKEIYRLGETCPRLGIVCGGCFRFRNHDGCLLGLRNPELWRLLELGPGRKCRVYSVAGVGGCATLFGSLPAQQIRLKGWFYIDHRVVSADFIRYFPYTKWYFGQCIGALVYRSG